MEGIPLRDTFHYLMAPLKGRHPSVALPVMTKIESKNVKLFSGPRLIGMAFLAAGLFSILSPQLMEVADNGNRSLWTGLAFVLFGIFVGGTYSGTEVDIAGKRFRNYKAFLGIKFREWVELPQLDGIYLVSQSEEFTNLPNGISPTLSGTVTDYYVMAISDQIQPVFSLAYIKQAEAQQAAEQLSKGLKVPLK